MADGTSTVPIRFPSTISGTARRRGSLSTQVSSTDTDGRPYASAMRCATVRSDSSMLPPPSSRRAISAVRSASLRPRSASSALAVAVPDSVLTTRATTTNTASATQFSPSAMVNCPVGGMWKKLNASALRTAVSTPNQSPQRLETSSTASM